jgi:hypothetical protein
VIAHLIENEARGELILVDKAKALIELERSFRSDLSSEKDSEDSSESFSVDHRKDNYKKTSIFVFQTQMTFVFCYIFLMHQKNLRPVNDSHQLLNL